jgi:L-amino acid N-acyltransferase YncA
MTFKIAQKADLIKIVDIYNSVVPSRMVTADLEPISVESRYKWFDEHDPATRPLWVVQNVDNQIVGWVSFQNLYNRPAYHITVEISIYLDETVRGKGLGKQVLAHALAQAPQFGIENIVGLIFAHNEPSIKLFKYAGFEIWGDLPEVTILDGVKRSVLIMGKKVYA